MNKLDFVQTILQGRGKLPGDELVSAYAPSNIALVKYWGKRQSELNLPMTSSLSISLASRGVTTALSLREQASDEIYLNQQKISAETAFAKRLSQFLDLFRPPGYAFHVHTHSNLPIAAGLASSAAGFSALVLALDLLFAWHLSDRELSLLARLGSGSACRSLWSGFVEWHAGKNENGLDSYAEPLNIEWPEFRVGLLIEHPEEKMMSSREAMKLTAATSPFYKVWPEVVAQDLEKIRTAILQKDFSQVGQVAESNAMSMHATMLAAQPSILYWQGSTVQNMQKIWQLRQEGMQVYFTEDAGPNLKLLFLAKDEYEMQKAFPKMEIVVPFG